MDVELNGKRSESRRFTGTGVTYKEENLSTHTTHAVSSRGLMAAIQFRNSVDFRKICMRKSAKLVR